MTTWCKELTYLKRPWCWERLNAGGQGDDRGWDGWMASPTQQIWVWVNSGVGEGNSTLLQYSCLENPMDGGAWWAAVHGVGKSRTRLSYFAFTFHFHVLEKEMATYSSVLAWRIPGTGEPGGLPSMGSHRVGHDWSDLAAAPAANSGVDDGQGGLMWCSPWGHKELDTTG